MKNLVQKVFALMLILFLTVYVLKAQRTEGDIGVGFQFGDPNGVSVKFYNHPASVDLLVAWKKNNYTMINGNIVFDMHINHQNNFHFIYGPGVFLLLNSDNSEFGSDADVGISGLIGLDYLIDNFEIFIQAIPRINLSESSDIDVGGGLGIRYYF